jgi:hypothetical protein
MQAHYSLYLGAALPLYSTAKREAELRSMHEVNHRELPIAKLAARVADFLWPNCQENIDQALADAKAASANMRVIVEEDVYVPPEVPHFLPFTSWSTASRLKSHVMQCCLKSGFALVLDWDMSYVEPRRYVSPSRCKLVLLCTLGCPLSQSDSALLTSSVLQAAQFQRNARVFRVRQQHSVQATHVVVQSK